MRVSWPSMSLVEARRYKFLECRSLAELLVKTGEVGLLMPKKNKSQDAVVSHEMQVYGSDNRRHVVFFSNQRESVIDSFPDAKSTLALTSSPQLSERICGERSNTNVFDYTRSCTKPQHHNRNHNTQRWCTSTPWRNGSDKLSCCSKRARPRCVSPQLIACSMDNNADSDFFPRHRLASRPSTTFRTLTRRNTQVRRGSAQQRKVKRRPVKMRLECPELPLRSRHTIQYLAPH